MTMSSRTIPNTTEDIETLTPVPTTPAPIASTSSSSASASATKTKSRPPPAVHLIAGGLGGMCGSIVTAPFDLVKTRLQSDMFQPRSTATTSTRTLVRTSPIRQLLNAFADTGLILRDVYRYEGPSALFKGLGPTLVGVVPGRSINFFVYGNGKQIYADTFNDGRENAVVHLSAAATAGIITAAATNPIWVVKTVMQLQQQSRPTSSSSSSSSSSSLSRTSLPTLSTPPHHSTTTTTSSSFSHSFRSITSPPSPLMNRPTSLSTTLHIYRKEGLKGFYKGLSASLLGVTEGTIQWSLYEQFKILARKSDERSRRRRSGLGSTEETSGGGWRVSAAAGGAKLVATMITYPHEVIRTRLRQPSAPGQVSRYKTLSGSFNLILKEEGWRALYGGMSPHLLRVVPNAVTMFWVYEKVVDMFKEEVSVPALRERRD